jgi:hypothetical protein
MMVNHYNYDDEFNVVVEEYINGKPLETLTKKFPDYEAELKQVEAIQELKESVIPPKPDASLSRFVSLSERFIEVQKPRRKLSRRSSFFGLRLAWNVGFAALLLVVFGFGGTLFFGLSRSSVVQDVFPGHLLYGWKRFGESVVLKLTHSEPEQQAYQNALAVRRLDEINLLQYHERAARFSFTGIVEDFNNEQVLVSGIVCPLFCNHSPTHAAEPAQIVGALNIGSQVFVEAFTAEDGTMHVARITVQEP